MATARLRRTVQYPSLADEPMHLDEDEQDALISSLRSKNAAQNRVYCTCLFLTATATSFYYLSLLSTDFFPALLSVTSLGLTALSLYPSTSIHTYLSPHSRAVAESAIELSTIWTGEGPDTGDGVPAGISAKKWGKMPVRPAAEAEAYADPFAGRGNGPLQRALPLLNTGACVVLLLLAAIRRRQGNQGSAVWVGPAGIWGLVWTAGRIMQAVNISELEGLKYRLKGA